MSTPSDAGLTGLVSIHDVMPETLGYCRRLVTALDDAGVHTLTLLVVPGRQWSSEDLRSLRQWQDRGIHLAGHGWRHRTGPPRTLYHRLHGALLSRRAAEHLSLNAVEIAQRMRDCFAWFERNDLAPPALYVPPAWALGPLPKPALLELPFSFVELLGGVLNGGDGSYRRLPLTGYEADTAWRAFSLGLWNRCNAWAARVSREPLRIGIHPFDAELHLNRQMQYQIDSCQRFISYPALFDQTVS